MIRPAFVRSRCCRFFALKNRIPYRIDQSLTGLVGPDYDATVSFGLPFEPEDFQHGKSRMAIIDSLAKTRFEEVPAI